MSEFQFAQELTAENVKKFVNNGDKITNDQMKEFISLCKARQVDPFLKEIYIQGYVNRKTGKGNFNFYIGKDGTLLRARRIPDYAGHEVGWFWADGTRVQDPIGGDKIVGAYCKVFIKGFETPINASALLTEYAPTELKATWASHTTQMIAKCAIVAAHRNAYPEAFGGLYAKEELDKVRSEGEEGVGTVTVTEQREKLSEAEVTELIGSLNQCELQGPADKLLAKAISGEKNLDESVFPVLKAYSDVLKNFGMSRQFMLTIRHMMDFGEAEMVCAMFIKDLHKEVDELEPREIPLIKDHMDKLYQPLVNYLEEKDVDPQIQAVVLHHFADESATQDEAVEA